MNPRLSHLHPYPFQRLRQLLMSSQPPANQSAINLSLGEPKHPTPDCIKQAIVEHLNSLAQYPATQGSEALRQACAQWMQQRYGISLNPAQDILPVNGSREALFSFVQAMIDPNRSQAPVIISPNPFYQIYEGASLLAGAEPYYVNCLPDNRFQPDWSQVPETIWQRTQLVFVCSPGNPTGAVMNLTDWEQLFFLSDRYGFIIASDECYSEIHFGTPPLGGLEAAMRLGRNTNRLVMFTSLSKRSNAPGLRSGFVAGDANLLASFLLYRTYHGSALSSATQAASIAAWQDETHVEANRQAYIAKFNAVTPRLASVMTVQAPEASFYLWAKVPGGDDIQFTKQLFEQTHVTVLPGSYLAREAHGINPGAGYIRIALVAPLSECVNGIERIIDFCQRM